MKRLSLIALMLITLASCRQNKTTGAKYLVNEDASKANWKGSATDHFHVGAFKVQGGITTDDKGLVNGGNFVIPVLSIQDFDLKDPIRQVLLSDLKSINFFNAVTHPNASFKINKVEPLRNLDTATMTGANYKITGNFTMVGQTHSISFPAKITRSADSLLTEATFNIDRTKWGMKIYSDPKQKLYIYPNVQIRLDVRAKRAVETSAMAFLYYSNPGK